MKAFNEKHEAIIYCDKIDDSLNSTKKGDIVTVKDKVRTIKFHTHVQIGYDNHQEFVVDVTKDFIIDLYHQIVEIESKSREEEYDGELPF